MTIPCKITPNGCRIPSLGLGTYGMGGLIQRDPANDDLRDITAIQSALDAGVTHIDTAELYASGYAEELVGKAIRGYSRSPLFLVSKVQREHLNYDDVKKAAVASIERLQSDYLDLYLLHRYPSSEKLPECIAALNELVGEGLVRHIGISNFNLPHTKDACRFSNVPIAAIQVHYNLQFREPERCGLIRYCQLEGIVLIAWRPINQGRVNKTGTDLTKSGVALVDEMCHKYGKTPAQIAINWLISQENIVSVVKTSSWAHLHDNLGAVGWTMDSEDLELLRTAFPHQKDISDNQPLK